MKYDILPGVKGLIFDLDGTLADSMPYHFEGWKRACHKFGAEMDPEFLRRHAGSPGRLLGIEVIRKCGLEGKVTPEQLVDEKLKQFSKLQHKIKPVKPVVDIVRKYHKKMPMAIGTGGHRETVESTLEIIGLGKYFDIIVTANDVDNFKPHPETFLKCAVLMDVEPAFIEVFEDGDYGLNAARMAGMIATDIRSWYDSEW